MATTKLRAAPRKLVGDPRKFLEGSRKLVGCPGKFLEGSRKLVGCPGKFLEGSRKLVGDLRKFLEGSRNLVGCARNFLGRGRSLVLGGRKPRPGEYMLQLMKSLLVEVDDDLAGRLERVAPARFGRRSDFIRVAILKALWDAEERATSEAYERQPDSPELAFDPAAWEGRSAPGERPK